MEDYGEMVVDMDVVTSPHQSKESLFETVRRNYYEANREYIQEQIQIASKYMT